MKQIFPLLLILAFGFARNMLAALPQDSYPDKPLDFFGEVKVASLTDCVDQLRKYTGKAVVLPDGVAAAMAKYPSIDTMFGGGNQWPGGHPITLRDFLGTIRGMTKLAWHYDAAKEAFIFTFPWEVRDDRTNAELLKILADSKLAAASFENLWQRKPDPWGSAFDALAGKPENRSIAPVMRWIANQTQEGIEGENRFAGMMADENGKSHLVILKDHGPMDNPGEDYISYYLFAQDGKIEEAGVMDGGGENIGTGHTNKASLNDAKTRVTLDDDLVFAVEKSRFVLKEKTVRGKPADPAAFTKFDRRGKLLFVLDAGETARYLPKQPDAPHGGD